MSGVSANASRPEQPLCNESVPAHAVVSPRTAGPFVITPDEDNGCVECCRVQGCLLRGAFHGHRTCKEGNDGERLVARQGEQLKEELKSVSP